jgi:hypothetical protein
VSGLGTGVATFLATPSSANLAAALTDETGSGAAVFATSPSLTTPTLGVATATSINKVAITAPATSATLTIANGKTLTVNATITFGGTDGTSMTFPAFSDTVAGIGTAQSWTKRQGFSVSTLTDGATITWDVTSAQKAKVTLGANRTMGAVSNAVDGDTYTLEVFQDATGSRTLTWTTSGAGSFDFGTAGAPTLTTTASKADILCFEAVTIGGTLKLRYLGAALGFA